MKNLFIIGNGFDRAHNLETNYSQFIDYILDSHFNDRKKYSNLILIKDNYRANAKGIKSRISRINDINAYLLQNPGGFDNQEFRISNVFFLVLLHSNSKNNWCDIEQEYYQLLYREKPIIKVQTLNKNFKDIKVALEEYLTILKDDKAIIESYKFLFNSTKVGGAIFVNFNYTNTLDRYGLEKKNNSRIDIHGQINDEFNPIIFGYAPKREVLNELMKLGNDYLENIKQSNYIRWSFDRKIKRVLKDSGKESINVFILGHSLGESDELLLGDVLNNESVKSIRVLYYEKFENFFASSINMERIMGSKGDASILKLLSFNESIRMPQHNDKPELIKEFREYITDIINAK